MNNEQQPPQIPGDSPPQPGSTGGKKRLVMIVALIVIALLVGSGVAYGLLVSKSSTQTGEAAPTPDAFTSRWITFADAELIPEAKDISRKVAASSDGNTLVMTVRHETGWNADPNVATTRQYAFISRDSGETWSALDLPLIKQSQGREADSINGLTISADGKKIALSIGEWGQGNTSGAQDSGYVLVSSDTGASWTKKTLPNGSNPFGVHISPDGAKLYVGITRSALGVPGSWLYKSDDFGQSWKEISPTSTAWNDYDYGKIALSADGSKVAIPATWSTTPSLYVSQDGGATWAVRKSADWTDSTVGATGIHTIGWSSDGKLAVAISSPKVPNELYSSKLYTSNDNGTSWSSFALGDSKEQGKQSIVGAQINGNFTNNATMYVVSIDGVVYRASTNSQSVAKIDLSSDKSLSDITVFDSGKKFIGLSEDSYYLGRL